MDLHLDGGGDVRRLLHRVLFSSVSEKLLDLSLFHLLYIRISVAAYWFIRILKCLYRLSFLVAFQPVARLLLACLSLPGRLFAVPLHPSKWAA